MKKDIYQIMELCLLAGKIMLVNGGETYRVEDTMGRIAKAYLVKEAHSYVTPTGIFLTIQGVDKEEELTKFIRITERSINLNKVVLVNDISRRISSGDLTIVQASEKLKKVEIAKPIYSITAQIIASAIAGGFFTLMFDGVWQDFLPAFIAGGAGFAFFTQLNKTVKVKFFNEILTSFLIGVIAHIFIILGLGINLDKIIIGSIMPLVPGLLITNAVRDIIAGDLVSGLARGAEALFTALALGVGIAGVIALYSL